MNQLQPKISVQVIRRVSARALKLAERVEYATDQSPHKRIRESGAQLIELLHEWVEEIADMHAAQDEDLEERLVSFVVRLKMAEAKVATWPETKKAPQRRRKRRRKKPTHAA